MVHKYSRNVYTLTISFRSDWEAMITAEYRSSETYAKHPTCSVLPKTIQLKEEAY
jgi:hypothetical protein